jgi:hypothetical protein
MARRDPISIFTIFSSHNLIKQAAIMGSHQKHSDRKQAQRYLLDLRHGKADERRRMRA